MKDLTIGILGATGAVGTEILKILQERDVQMTDLRLLADQNDAGTVINFRGQDYLVQETSEDTLDGIDILLTAVPDAVSLKFSPIAVNKGAIVIDNSAAYRMDPEVPLVIPEVNPEDISGHKGIIASPNCTTIIALVAINALHQHSRIKRLLVSTYQAVSGAGIDGIHELEEQSRQYLNHEAIEPSVFQHQIAFNLIPAIDSFTPNGYTVEEMRLHNEVRKIWRDDEIAASCTCVRVPVLRSHSESIYIEFEEHVSVEKAMELLRTAKGVRLVDDVAQDLYPMPLDTSDQDLVYVGRVRQDLTQENALNLWCCGDQVRKGAATNSVQIAELVIAKYFTE